MHPGRQILRRVSDDTRLMVCEPIGDLPGASDAVTGKRHGQLLSFTLSSR